MAVRHRDELEWETIRWPGETGKMLFHPRQERPTEPNAGILRLEPGAHHPLHYHDFAQVWYILEGSFQIGGRECGPGTMIFHPDPHYEDDFHTTRIDSTCRSGAPWQQNASTVRKADAASRNSSLAAR
jgi:hypothetical protein